MPPLLTEFWANMQKSVVVNNMQEPLTMTVSELNNGIKKLLDSRSGLQNIFIRGEISNFKRNISGHLYLSLKDEGSVLKACMFKSQAMGLTFAPQDGDCVVARGRISVYVPGGAYQMYIEEMRPEGVGDLHRRFLMLKTQLEKEGLFAQSRKRPLPLFPKKIGVVTSDTGAVIRDIINVSGRRHPMTEIILYPSKVQGEDAAAQIVEGIRYFNTREDIDVLIVGRGGGSIEDLWPFNEEIVARAVFASGIPIISAVGHETDTTICDLVADKRAATPSQAAEFAVPDDNELRIRLRDLRLRLDKGLLNKTNLYAQKLLRLSSSPALVHFARLPEELAQKLDERRARLDGCMQDIISKKAALLKEADASLRALSPLAVLSRGYSVALHGDGKPVRSVHELSPGSILQVKFHDGLASTCVISTNTSEK